MKVLVDEEIIKKCLKEVRVQIKNYKEREKSRLKRIKKHLKKKKKKKKKKVKTAEIATQTEYVFDKVLF